MWCSYRPSSSFLSQSALSAKRSKATNPPERKRGGVNAIFAGPQIVSASDELDVFFSLSVFAPLSLSLSVSHRHSSHDDEANLILVPVGPGRIRPRLRTFHQRSAQQRVDEPINNKVRIFDVTPRAACSLRGHYPKQKDVRMLCLER